MVNCYDNHRKLIHEGMKSLFCVLLRSFGHHPGSRWWAEDSVLIIFKIWLVRSASYIRKATLVSLKGVGQLLSVCLCFGRGTVMSCGWALRHSGTEAGTSVSRDNGCALASRNYSFANQWVTPVPSLREYLTGRLHLAPWITSSSLEGNESFAVIPFWRKKKKGRNFVIIWPCIVSVGILTSEMLGA